VFIVSIDKCVIYTTVVLRMAIAKTPCFNISSISFVFLIYFISIFALSICHIVTVRVSVFNVKTLT